MKRVRWEYDEDYETRGSYAYDTDEETKAAEEWELERLRSGEFAALGFIVEKHCETCDEWYHVDSLWGIVMEDTDANRAEMLREHGHADMAE